MGFFELFSRRNAPEKVVDVYRYDEIPESLRNQIIHILREIIVPHTHAEYIWDEIENRILKEFGLLELEGYSSQNSVEIFLLRSDDKAVIYKLN